MRKVGSREFKNRLGRYLAEIRQGRSIIITDRGKAVAKVSPVSSGDDSGHELNDILKKLQSEGKLRLGTRPLRRFRPVRGRGKSASEMIIEDRR